ncbi:hypothetical protein [Mycolicibacterium sp. P9-64]|uniref:hypothetical protein n=1 Tax=Mycolicibacterium sp. P9-64 TaxID=2024612 RepID=UPI0015643A32|nr:hypothetical protein [Mycolicibacterium sp. P9-64]
MTKTTDLRAATYPSVGVSEHSKPLGQLRDLPWSRRVMRRSAAAHGQQEGINP